MGKPHAYIISPAYNCKRYIKASVLSVVDQLPAYPDLTHVIVDDCSNDGTWERLQEDDLSFPDHQYLLRQPVNGASAVGSFMTGVEFVRDNLYPSPDDIVFWLDGDDWLCDPKAISKMVRAYRNPAVEMAYSDHVIWTGGVNTKEGCYSHPMVDRTRARYAHVCYSHLRSFKWDMLDRVPKEGLIDPKSGAYWKFAGDSALFLPMLEVATRVKHIREPLYVYNEEREDNEAKKDATEQRRCSVNIRSQPPNINGRPEAWPTAFAPTQRFKMDFGRACNLSCSFCYYLHQKPWKNKTTEEIEAIIRAGAQRGNRMCDISGGEPSIAKDLPLWLDICKKYGLAPGIITHGQDLADKLEVLWDHGLADVLFSIHGTREYHNKVTGTEKRDGYGRLWNALEKCTEANFRFRTNTVLTDNHPTLPALAEELTKVSPYISNFILFNPHGEWAVEEKPFQAKISDIAPHLMAAIDTLYEHGTAVNVRYFPFCALKGYEKHIVHYPQVMYDPWEWDYSVPKTHEACAAKAEEFANKFCVYTHKCMECNAAGTACPGINRVYYETFGDEELQPYKEGIDGAFHWRREADDRQLYTYVGANHEWSQERERRRLAEPVHSVPVEV